MAGRYLLRSIFLLCLLGALGTFPPARSTDIDVRVLECCPVLAEKDSNLTLSCKINRELALLLEYNVDWLKESRVPNLANETLSISRQETILVGRPLASRYNVNMTHLKSEESIVSALQIQKVEDADDARYVCQVTSIKNSAVAAKTEVDVIVPKKAEGVLLKVDGVLAQASGSSSKVTLGSHRVQCIIEGFNLQGQEEMKVDLNGQRMGTTSVTTSLMPMASTSARAPRYRIQGETRLEMGEGDNGKTLTCAAVKSGVVNSTTLRLVPKPSVDCDDVRVHHHDKHVRLVCVVSHVDVTVYNYLWELSDSDIVYSSEGPADNQTGVTQEPSDTQTKVTLRLDVESWGDARSRFRLTALTEVGDVWDDVYITVVSDEEETDVDDHDESNTNDDDKGSNTDGDDSSSDRDQKGGSSNKSGSQSVSKMVRNPAILPVMLLLLGTCLHA